MRTTRGALFVVMIRRKLAEYLLEAKASVDGMTGDTPRLRLDIVDLNRLIESLATAIAARCDEYRDKR